MSSIFGFVVGLLQSALALIGFVQVHPELPQAQREQAVQVAQQAVTQATQALAPNTITNDTVHWKTYANAEYGFAVQYPSDWTI